MSIPYPWEVDWFYVGTEIVMPVLIWLFVFLIVVILLDIAGRAYRRGEPRFLWDLDEEPQEPRTAPETPGAITTS